MQKKDLKSGNVVVLKNGEKRVLIGDYLMDEGTGMNIGEWNENLKAKYNHDFDIMKVFQFENAGLYNLLDVDYNAKLLWERKEKSNVFEFGKYKGRTFKEVIQLDPSYIKWCKDNIRSINLSESEDKLWREEYKKTSEYKFLEDKDLKHYGFKD